MTGKVYEGVPLHLTVQKHSIKGREGGCLGHKPRGVEMEEYNSHNTERLTVEELKQLLLTLDYVKEELANYKK